MASNQGRSMLLIPVLVAIGAVLALACSQGGSALAGVPILAWTVGLAFVIQWVAFIPAWLRQTEKFFDLTGSLTYIVTMSLALFLSPNLDARAVLLWALVIVWAIRLGSFLFGRIHRAGKDDRFDSLKPFFWRFLGVWTIQALWVSFTAAAALTAVTSLERKPIDAFAVVGALIWALGFGFEVVADEQKRRFAADPAQRGKFIHSGLWARSRHPNYFGEIVLWAGVAVIALPVLQGWQWVALISPVFVFVLLTRVSGIPLLERKAEAKWGGQADYEAYKARTPVLVPRLR